MPDQDVGGNDIILHNARRSSTLGHLKTIVERLRARGIELVVFSLGKNSKMGVPDASEGAVLQSTGAAVLPAMQTGVFDNPKLHVESSWQTDTERHLNAEVYGTVVQRTLPAIEGGVAKVK